MKALTQEILDSMGCHTPGYTHNHSVLYIHPQCHDEGIEARYDKRSGNLSINRQVIFWGADEVATPTRAERRGGASVPKHTFQPQDKSNRSHG
jgi:hypothetical protein